MRWVVRVAQHFGFQSSERWPWRLAGERNGRQLSHRLHWVQFGIAVGDSATYASSGERDSVDLAWG